MENLGEKPHFVLFAAILLVASTFIYNTLSRPMAKLPGPWYTNWTGLVLKYKVFKAERNDYVEKLHEKYGPVVRTTPNEVSIRDPSVAQNVYRTKGGYPKSEFYDRLARGMVNVFTTRSVDIHRRHRRLLSAGMSESNIVSLLPIIDGKVRLAIQKMGEEAEERGVTDVYHWFMCMATDVIGELTFGKSFNMLENGGESQYMSDLKAVGKAGGIRTEVPRYIELLLKVFGIRLVENVVDNRRRMAQYAEQSLKRQFKIHEEAGDDAKPSLFDKLYKQDMTFTELRDSAQTYIVAGSDTTSNTLTYLLFSVLRHADIKEKLLNELKTLPDGWEYNHVKSLPYLNQVIEETLRLYPAAPGNLPRDVPSDGVMIKGQYIPGGAVVGSSAYVMQHNPEVFPEPLKFDPSRWENPTQEMKDSFMAFGAASRICLGIHLARMELRLGVARFMLTYPNARVSSKEGFAEEDMDPEMFFLLAPKGRRCLLELS